MLEGLFPKEFHVIDWWMKAEYREGTLNPNTDKPFVSKEEWFAWIEDCYNNSMRLLQDGIDKGVVIVHEDESSHVFSTLPSDHFDYVYLDGERDSYSGYQEEMKNAARVLKDTGFIAGHDFVEEHWRGRHDITNVENVLKFCSESDWKLFAVTYYNFVLRKK